MTALKCTLALVDTMVLHMALESSMYTAISMCSLLQCSFSRYALHHTMVQYNRVPGVLAQDYTAPSNQCGLTDKLRTVTQCDSHSHGAGSFMKLCRLKQIAVQMTHCAGKNEAECCSYCKSYLFPPSKGMSVPHS